MMKGSKKQWAFLYMPLIFVACVFTLLFLLIKPYKDTISLYANAITIATPADTSKLPKSIFDEELAEQMKKEREETKGEQTKIPSSEVEYPNLGIEYGSVSLDKQNVQTRLIYGDSNEDLRVGVGHFNGSVFPGEGGTTLIGGHNTADLASLEQAEIGDTVTIRTNYGTYTYKINDKQVKKYDDRTAIASLYEKSDDNHLILYTCYPIDMIGLTDDRLFVYADLISGDMIDPSI